MSHLSVTPFLRNVLIADGAMGVVTALVMLLGSDVLQPLLQLPAWLMLVGGAVLAAYGLLVGWLSRRGSLPRGLLWALVVFNLAWAFDFALVAFASWLQPSALGQAFLGAHIVAGLLFAQLQYMALQRDRALGGRVPA
ncbi:hypothetical protein [Piscinibacter sp. HJYY11]|uniref:hypothetical protein n=1 Tax=Piscinibacter sp. HJYY11 TaxID=2801333 RepID=UPI00191E34F6|nr:hypothetical protein [Piscinibacter sp. HJYY11]MBL0731060.1 hypothetical protein [Piscinibacter sp. HJYY11]